VIKNLLLRGAQVHAFDPVAAKEALKALTQDLAEHPQALERLKIHATAYEATEQADALLVLTEWKTFHHPDFQLLKSHMKQALILDGRNLYDPEWLQDMGIAYQGIGRRNDLALTLKRPLEAPSAVPLMALS
jgi:UDPglucose 6-dehydrogenase